MHAKMKMFLKKSFLYLIDTLTPKDLASGLELCLIEDRQWFIHGMCAKTGSGIIESITLLIEAIKRTNMIRT